MTSESTLTFLGGAGTVTGSKTLLDTSDSRVLVDCGLFQGKKFLRKQNWEAFPLPPDSIDAILLTHAHLDHIGYLPRLARLGFNGPVYCTRGTAALAGIVLPDSGRIHEEEARFANKKGYSKHDPALPLYTEADARECLEQLVIVPFDTEVDIPGGLGATWSHAGHILGAASIRVALGANRPKVVFSGDLGRATHPLLRPPAPPGEADAVVTESTYGERDHGTEDESSALEEVINRVSERDGVLVIPAFAVDRTEVVLWHLNQLVGSDRIPGLPIYIDSPMASRALDVYEDEARRGSPEIRPLLHGSPLFPHIRPHEARSVEESKALNVVDGPMIIISASGMATGGRVVHHLAQRIGDPRNAVVLVGYQAPGTRGDALASGALELKMLGKYHAVAAEVIQVDMSAHADRGEILDWLGSASPQPEVIYVNHGEGRAAEALAGSVRRRTKARTVIPRQGEQVNLTD